MTHSTQSTSKIEARRRAREATRKANETRIARERDNIEDAATCMVAIAKVAEIDTWESERLAAVREQVRAEASKRRAEYRGEAGAALARMQGRGESLTTIAALTGVGVTEVRALLRHAPMAATQAGGIVGTKVVGSRSDKGAPDARGGAPAGSGALGGVGGGVGGGGDGDQAGGARATEGAVGDPSHG